MGTNVLISGLSILKKKLKKISGLSRVVLTFHNIEILLFEVSDFISEYI